MSLRRRQVFLNGVNVVLCGNADSFHGAAIAWGTRVEKDHVMVSLPKQAAVTVRVGESGTFTISVLFRDQSDIARQYGGKSQTDPRDVDPRDLNFTQWAVPVVEDACAQVLCEVRHRLTVKEQVIVIAKIIDTAFPDRLDPLVYDHSHYFSE